MLKLLRCSSPSEDFSATSPPSSPDCANCYGSTPPSSLSASSDESDSSCGQTEKQNGQTTISKNMKYGLNDTETITEQVAEAAPSEARQIAQSEHVMLDHSMFGTVTQHLMAVENAGESSSSCLKINVEIQVDSETREQILQAFAEKYRMEGLPIELDGQSATINEEQAFINPKTRTVMFGCKTLPSKFLRKTLQDWIKTPSLLRRLVISTQDMQNRSKMEELCQQLPLVKLWSLSNHETSVYRMQNISEYQEKCGGKDLASIYVLICEDFRIAVMAVSDYALSVSFGGALPNSFVFPLMKFALAEIANCNGFYQIKDQQLREQWETVKNNFRKRSNEK